MLKAYENRIFNVNYSGLLSELSDESEDNVKVDHDSDSDFDPGFEKKQLKDGKRQDRRAKLNEKRKKQFEQYKENGKSSPSVLVPYI